MSEQRQLRVERISAYRCEECGETFLMFRDGESHYVLNGPDHKYAPVTLIDSESLAEELDARAAEVQAEIDRGDFDNDDPQETLQSVKQGGVNAYREIATLVREGGDNGEQRDRAVAERDEALAKLARLREVGRLVQEQMLGGSQDEIEAALGELFSLSDPQQDRSEGTGE